jgi:hypothetical protein
MDKKTGSIHPPERTEVIPKSAQWLFGQGAGAWFFIEKLTLAHQYTIKRFAANGGLDCDRIFELEDNGFIFDIEKEYAFTHVSHCSRCRINQDDQLFIFNYKNI